MKVLQIQWRLTRLLWLAALNVAATGCGADLSVESRAGSSRPLPGEENAINYLDSEDVIAIMQAPDKVNNQTFPSDEIIERQRSLIPLDDFIPEISPLNVVESPFLLQDESTDIKELTDLRSFDTPIKNQGSRPWCTAFATIGAIENIAQRLYGSTLDLSEIHHFNSYGVYQTAPSLNAARTTGLIDEDLWPYYGNKKIGFDSRVRARLNSSKKIQLTLSDILLSMRDGLPVIINLTVNSSFMNPKAGGVIVPGGFPSGGHAIALTGVVVDNRVDGGGYFIVKNSWGASWGNKGYGYVPFSYCRFSSCYAWSISDVNVMEDNGRIREKLRDVTPRPDTVPDSQPTPKPVDPKPSIATVTAESFTLITELKDYRGLLGAYFYALTLSASQSALNQVASVSYHVGGYRDFTSIVPATGATIAPRDILSRSYKIWPGVQDDATATVKLKDGRELDIRGLTVEF